MDEPTSFLRRIRNTNGKAREQGRNTRRASAHSYETPNTEPTGGSLCPGCIPECVAETDRSPSRFEFGSVQMMKAQFTYWKESDGRYLAYLKDYPDHWTQGEDLDDLKEQLNDLCHTFTSEQIPGIRNMRELEVA